MNTHQKHYTVAELADILRVGNYRAAQLCREGSIPGAYKPFGTWLIRKDEFDAWLNAQGAA